MNNIYHKMLLCARRMFTSSAYGTPFSEDQMLDCERASEKIIQLLESDCGVMVARYGSTELRAITNYLGVVAGNHPLDFILGKQERWWWEKSVGEQMLRWSGFYPATEELLWKFGKMMIDDSKQLDLLGSWVNSEISLVPFIGDADKTLLRFIEPFWSKTPWTSAIKGKKVLVVHPFAKSILSQYKNRNKLFANPDVLPDFASLEVIPAVQSIGQGDSRFKDWFEALEWMKKEIDASDYDVCLIGCGAYGFPLAAHVKRAGKKAIHLGGALQLLFGIKGKRWEDPEYGVKEWGIPHGQYSNLMNEYWVRPSQDETPQGATKVEGGCYW